MAAGWSASTSTPARSTSSTATAQGRRLSGPNDLVFDDSGDFWFTDTGKFKGREREVGSLFYAAPDGSSITEVVHPAEAPNGVGLSPDGSHPLLGRDPTARLRARAITGPGQLAPVADHGSQPVCGLPGHQGFDSLAVDAEGNVCVATLLTGGVTVAAPDGSAVRQLLLPEALADHMTTNLCFGGPDLTTAYLTLGSTGRLVACPWPVAGLPLAFSHGSIPPAT